MVVPGVGLALGYDLGFVTWIATTEHAILRESPGHGSQMPLVWRQSVAGIGVLQTISLL